MEQQFKKILQKTKALNGQNDPLFKTFEGALFQDSAWFFHFQETAIPVVAQVALKREENSRSPAIISAPEAISKAVKVEDNNYLSEVLFVGDTYNGEGDDLLGKMITAMKLTGSEFNRFPMNEELEEVNDLAKNLETPNSATEKLLAVILEKKPKVVVSLGATVTNILLGKREKLSTIHGQFFQKELGECVYNLVPVFHPDFLVINPNMKRTAWIDLQKVMERVGKI